MGLAIGTSPEKENDPLFTILGWRDAQLNWHYALLAAGSVLVVIGLLHEIVLLNKWRTADGTKNREASFAVAFAVLWRIAIVCLLSICLVTAMLLTRQVVSLPESEAAFSYIPFPYATWVLCLIVVLSADLRRWRPKHASPSRRLVEYLVVCVAGMIIAVLVLPDTGLIHYLVHIATAGIELAQPVRNQWPGAFPDHRAEGFRTFWAATAAAGAVDVAILNYSLMANFNLNRRPRLVLSTVGVALPLLISAAFCIWYYGFELHRISPYLAAVGTGGNLLEWCAGILILGILVTAAAHRVPSSDLQSIAIERSIDHRPDSILLQDSALCLSLLIGAVVAYFVEAISTYLSMPWSLIGSAEVVLAMLRDPGAILMAAIFLLSVQLCWLRWRRRAEQVEWKLAAVEPRRFLGNWMAIAIISCVAIPTISAFVFAFWLGPWFLYGS
jgi:hypothetical protein